MSQDTTSQDKSLEDKMEEESTIVDYENVPTNIVPPYLRVKLWRHQYQLIWLMLRAEYDPPIQGKNGEVFYSRSGILCPSTGTGKTAIVLGTANYSVGAPAIDDVIFSTSLNTILLKEKVRQNIDVTVICASSGIIDDVWIKDIKTFYPELPYYRFATVGILEKEVRNSTEYRGYEIQAGQIKQSIGMIYNAYKSSQISQADFEISMSAYGDMKTEDEIQAYFAKIQIDLDDRFNEILDDRLISILKSVKVFFVSSDSFYFLFRIFKNYTISRMVLDEPQNTTLKNQKNFEDYIEDPRIKQLKSIGMGRMKPYPEQKFALFLWYISATPQLIPANDENHYINSWVSKNDVVISDYLNEPNNRLFPELIGKYVLKIPYSYILEARPELKSLCHEYKLKCKRRAETAILRGVLGTKIDSMLENDDYEGVISELDIAGGIKGILEKAVERLTIDIGKDELHISTYSVRTAQGIIDKSRAEINKKKQDLANLQKRIARYEGLKSAPEECPICFETLNVLPVAGEESRMRCIAHVPCMNIFHLHCIATVLKGQNKTCPICRIKLEEIDLKPTFDDKGNNLQQQIQNQGVQPQGAQTPVIDYTKEFASKKEALKTCLAPMLRGGNYYKRNKVLLFVEFKNDQSSNIGDIVKTCQEAGFNVRLPFRVGKKDLLLSKFPTINGYYVTQAGPSAKISEEIKGFAADSNPFVWIFRSGKESAGLNFPFVDTSIEYSVFKSHAQIYGRSVRMNRVSEVDMFTLEYN